MFHPLPLYVGLRYVRARSHSFFVSFITWASLLGVGVGVAALIVILSVMNGFESELRDRLLSLGAQVRVTEAAAASGGAARARPPPDWHSAIGLVRGAAGVGGVAPYAELQALVFAHLDDVRALAPPGTVSGGLRVRVQDVLEAPAVAARLQALLPGGLEVSDWTQDNANYFRAIRIEKTMMSLILLLIVAVAAFNIVAMLVMVVTDKRTDIAIVRTLGASPPRVMGIFITQGLVIGWLGVALGVVLGLALALHVDTIVPFLQRTFRFQILDAEVYYNTAIPAEVHWGNILAIAVAALLLTALATVYPAIRAARTPPAEALRYE